jgi:hypothetical protein
MIVAFAAEVVALEQFTPDLTPQACQRAIDLYLRDDATTEAAMNRVEAKFREVTQSSEVGSVAGTKADARPEAGVHVLTKSDALDAEASWVRAAQAAGTLEALIHADTVASMELDAADDTLADAVFENDPAGLASYRQVEIKEAEARVRMAQAEVQVAQAAVRQAADAGDVVNVMSAKAEVLELSRHRLASIKAPPAWHTDPIGVGALRYWTGTAWTAFVSSHGIVHEEI